MAWPFNTASGSNNHLRGDARTNEVLAITAEQFGAKLNLNRNAVNPADLRVAIDNNTRGIKNEAGGIETPIGLTVPMQDTRTGRITPISTYYANHATLWERTLGLKRNSFKDEAVPHELMHQYLEWGGCVPKARDTDAVKTHELASVLAAKRARPQDLSALAFKALALWGHDAASLSGPYCWPGLAYMVAAQWTFGGLQQGSAFIQKYNRLRDADKPRGINASRTYLKLIAQEAAAHHVKPKTLEMTIARNYDTALEKIGAIVSGRSVQA